MIFEVDKGLDIASILFLLSRFIQKEIDMEGIVKIYEFLDKVGDYFLATVEGDQPRVRVFGTALLYDGRLFIETGKSKAVSRQIALNPKVEICAWDTKMWMRLAGELEEDERDEIKVALLEKMPFLKEKYEVGDGNMQMLYFKKGVATFSTQEEIKEVITF